MLHPDYVSDTAWPVRPMGRHEFGPWPVPGGLPGVVPCVWNRMELGGGMARGPRGSYALTGGWAMHPAVEERAWRLERAALMSNLPALLHADGHAVPNPRTPPAYLLGLAVGKVREP
jgi:hypothetical protein